MRCVYSHILKTQGQYIITLLHHVTNIKLLNLYIFLKGHKVFQNNIKSVQKVNLLVHAF